MRMVLFQRQIDVRDLQGISSQSMNVPSLAPVRQSEVELAEMTNSILLILPANPLTRNTQTTFKDTIGLL